MTPDEFRRVALAIQGASEQHHMNHPDFRIGGRIFATLGSPDERTAMVKLTPEQQGVLIAAEPEIFRPAAGAWGRQGSTLARLDRLDVRTATSALCMAADNAASGPRARR